MEQLALLKELFAPVFEKCEVKLYDLKFVNDKKMKILQVMIMKNDGSMDLDTCALVSEQLSNVLDEHDVISQEYFLEVCSPGAERVIKDLAELPTLIGKHMFIRLKHPVSKMLEITGDLLAIENNILTMSYRDKALVKKVQFELSEIDFARLAVRI